MYDAIIIGAGACGLMAARELVKANKSVLILEARDRIGGRIHTLQDENSPVPLEGGAEFIHGDLPLTLSLLAEAKVKTIHLKWNPWESIGGEISPRDFFSAGWTELEKKLKKLEKDMSIAAFLQHNFSEDRYADLREQVIGFAEGFDAADPERASTFALRDEWLSDNDSSQYRVEGGYGKITEFLANDFALYGGMLQLNSIVKEIFWQKKNVQVKTAGEETFESKQLIITVPLGVITASANQQAAIRFSPQLADKIDAAQRMGYGSVTKVLLLFTDAFWKNDFFQKQAGKKIKDLGFLFTDQEIPTWWTTHPQDSALLCGWLGGPGSEALKNKSQEEIFQTALKSLSNAFTLDESELKEKIIAAHVFNWSTDPFALGAYAYATTETIKARKVLSTPVESTLFFAGEALFEGKEMGTVEAALRSGKETAEKILSSRN